VSGVSASPTSFYGGSGSTTFKYRIGATATVSVVVRNASGITVRTLRAASTQAAGTYSLAWDGRSDAGSYVPAGTYSALVKATSGSTTSTGTASVSVIASPISGVSVSPTDIYTDSGSSTLRYTVGTKATVSVVVQDASRITVRTLRSASTQNAGSYSITWDGKGASGAALPAGDYAFLITATTSVGTVTASQSVRLVAPLLSAASVAPASFYTGQGPATVVYTLSGAATVSVSVRDGSGSTIRLLQSGLSQLAGIYALAWDGKAEDGSAAGAGNYTVVVSAAGVAGTQQKSLGVQVVAPVLSSVSAAPSTFSTDGGSTTVSYTIAAAATTSTVVADGGGNTVRTLRSDASQAAGSYSIAWDGKADDGTVAAAGPYNVVVTASTAVGTVQGTAAVQLVAPALGAAAVSPSSFYAGSGSASTTYILTSPATVAVTIRDGSDGVVRTLQAAASQPAGTHTLAWDGKAEDGSSVSAGDYAVVIDVTGPAGAERRSLAVRVIAPVLSGVGLTPTAAYTQTGSTTLAYTIADAATTSVVAVDASGAPVRTLQTDASQPAGSYTITWDGKADDDSPVPAGSYTVIVRATTPVGTVQRSGTVQFVAPVLGATGVSAASFYGGAGASGSTTLSYTLSGPADVSVIAQDASGAKVATVQASAALEAGLHSVGWSGVADSGSSLRAGAYTLVVKATTAAGTERSTQTVQYTPTPLASEASLAVNTTGGYVLHTVVENWDETLNGQTAANYYYDGKSQPWEYTAVGGATVTLFVGVNPADQQDTTAGGSATGTSQTTGVVDLTFPASVSWSAPMYYSLRVSYGGSSRWYPAAGRYQVRPPTDANGHVQFVFISDIQTPLESAPVPDQQPSAMTSAYSAIPNLSLSLGWSKILSGVKSESAANLVVFGGDAVQRAGDATAPDDGATQWRQLLDNEQGFTGADEWSLSSLTSTVPVQLAIGNHDDLGVGDATTAAANRLLNNRWEYRPAQADSDRGYYTFDQGDVHFVVMNPFLTTATAQYNGWIGLQSLTSGGARTGAYGTYTNTRQGDWLIAALQTAKPWTVVITHAPVFDAQSSAAWSQVNQTGAVTTTNDIYYGERDRLLKLFAAKGVDLVLQGHLHYFRHHVEKVQDASGSTVSGMTFITQGLSGAAPIGATESGYGAWIDWIDQAPYNGKYDIGEPIATPADTHYDVSYFGTPNNTRTTQSGYTGSADTYHAPGEYGNGLTFGYSVFQTGTDGAGAPTLTMQVKTVSWNATTHQWDPWTVYESGPISQVSPGMVAQRFNP
jgi:flagellar hook assembly protein FlgD